MGETPPFWKTTPLHEMTSEQWESLCDGCARCCLHKVMDEETGRIHYTHVACRLLDRDTCRCTRYPERARLVPDCVTLTPDNTWIMPWMPETCAYRRIHEGRDLAWWHPLVSGDPESVHLAGISVQELTIAEEEADLDDLEFYIVDWIEAHSSDTEGFNEADAEV
ncbi:MAG: hypothetical protein CMH57_01795 [Myxococcales bacterium]|nr:hypothetical protein [Myxococcales bacterium]